MNFDLWCVVNAAGVPYNNTFRPNEDDSWGSHVWANVPKRGEHPDSATMEDMKECEEQLKANGDRAVRVQIQTSELVITTILTRPEDPLGQPLPPTTPHS